MAITVKNLVAGILTNSPAILYTAPVDTTTYVVSGIFHNFDSVSRQVDLSIQIGGNTRQIFSQVIDADSQYFFNERIIMEANDSIIANADASSAINYWISGAEDFNP